MNTQRAVSVALALTAAALLATGSLGFSSVSAERGVQVNVVDAEDAYVGVVACEKDSSNSSQNANSVRVWVTNQYSGPFDVSAITSDTGDSVAGPVPETLEPGESERFESLNADYEVTVEVTDGLDATVNVDVYSESNCPRSTSDDSPGGSDSSAGEAETTTRATTASAETTTADA